LARELRTPSSVSGRRPYFKVWKYFQDVVCLLIISFNDQSDMVLTACAQGACANVAVLVNAAYFSYFNPQVKHNS